MNDLYGVDPVAPANADDLISLLKMFGPTEGRFIADFPDDWIVQVRSALDAQPPLQRDRALEWLRRRRAAIVETNCRFTQAKKWAENAHALKDLAVGLIGPRGCSPAMMPIDQALYEVDSLPDARGAHVPRSASAYVKAAWPLLSISSKVVLVDPYFRLRDRDARGYAQVTRHRRVLVELLAEARRRRKVSTFCVCVSTNVALVDDTSGKEFESDLRLVADEAGVDGDVVIEYRVLDEDPGPRQHARYLLGRGCGIQFDHGFDTSRDGSRNHVHWLGSSEVGPLLKQFDLPDF